MDSPFNSEDWDLLMEVINDDLCSTDRKEETQLQVNTAEMMTTSQMPVGVSHEQVFYELPMDCFFVPPNLTPPPTPPQKPYSVPNHRRPHPKSSETKGRYIKKPPNAFMVYMKEQRPIQKAKHSGKDSASINRILGQMWKELTTDEQEKYFAESERLSKIHSIQYPGWSCRDNYGKTKKRKRSNEDSPNNSLTASSPEIPMPPHLPSTSSTCNMLCFFSGVQADCK
ncbi:transcription factor 7-like 1-A [Stigmatopora argus]